jgi:peptidoglycan hydrolase-like protein with peptidoglycan-binding domain
MDDARKDVAALMGKEVVPTPEPTISIRTLSEGCTGEDVRALQILLTGRGCKADADGIFGPKTRSAVEKFRKKANLPPDITADIAVWRSLLGTE